MRHYTELKITAAIVSAPNTEAVAAAVATLVVNDNQILLGKRFAGGQFCGWQCPGGYLQKNQSIEQAAKQHCLHKAGIEISQLEAGPYSNNIFPDQHHTVTLYIIAKNMHVTNNALFENAQNQWRWFDISALPSPLFLPLKNLFDSAAEIPCGYPLNQVIK